MIFHVNSINWHHCEYLSDSMDRQLERLKESLPVWDSGVKKQDSACNPGNSQWRSFLIYDIMGLSFPACGGVL